MSRPQAIDLARQLVAEGHARRWHSDDDGVAVESDQGWYSLWTPADEQEPAPQGADDTNPET